MTVVSTDSRKSYAGNGVTTSFATSPVVFFDSAELTVYVITTATSAILATLVEDTDYTVSGGDGTTGTINTAAGSAPYGAPATGTTLLIVRELAYVQESDFVNNDPSDAEVAEDALDKLTMMAQQLDTRLERSVHLDDSDVSGASTELPTPEANTLIGWNDDGDALQNYTAEGLSTALTTAFTLTLLDDATSNAFLTTLTAARSESGAAAVSVLTKLREIVSVADFGAVGDGVTNDSTAFTNARSTGRLVFIPKTTSGYQLTTTVSTTSGAWLPEPTLTWTKFSDGGQLNILRGFDTDNGANIWRFADRVFVGEAAAKFAGDSLAADGGTSWFSNSTNYPGYLAINGQLVVTTNTGKYAIVAATRNSDNAVGSTEIIGVGSSPINDKASGNAWGFIAELQHESGASQSFGMEVSAKNKGSDLTTTPNAQTGGVFGLWLAGGGDNTFGGSAANPSTAGIVLLKNAHTWNTGIVVMKDALTSGRVMAMSSEGTGGAHFLGWYDSSGNTVLSLTSSATGSTAWKMLVDNNGFNLQRDGNTVLLVGSSVTVANGVHIFGHSTGQVPKILAIGETNVGLEIGSKGSGDIYLNPGTGNIKWGKALVALGGGAAPTLGTIGATGPGTAGQNSWMRVLDSAGAAFWVPTWK